MQNLPPPTSDTITSAGDHAAAADLCEPVRRVWHERGGFGGQVLHRLPP